MATVYLQLYGHRVERKWGFATVKNGPLHQAVCTCDLATEIPIWRKRKSKSKNETKEMKRGEGTKLVSDSVSVYLCGMVQGRVPPNRTPTQPLENAGLNKSASLSPTAGLTPKFGERASKKGIGTWFCGALAGRITLASMSGACQLLIITRVCFELKRKVEYDLTMPWSKRSTLILRP
ncbi:hypothetical protein PoB_000915300, partial [Plakobranchus ocellatus]